MIGDAMEDSAFNSMMSINHIGSKSIAEIRQQSIHSFVQLRRVFLSINLFFSTLQTFQFIEFLDPSKSFDPPKNKNVKVLNLTVRAPKETLNASDSSNLVQVHPMINLSMGMVNESSKFGVSFMNKQEVDNQTGY